MKKLSALLLTVLLASCAPMQGSQESWARQIFAPSSETLKRGCGMAFDTPQPDSIGQLRLRTSTKRLIRFSSVPGDLYIFCGLFGIIAPGEQARDSFLELEGYRRFSQNAHLFVIVEGDDLKMNQVGINISLTSATDQELLQIKPDSVEGVTPGIRFNFEKVQENRRSILDSVTSFTITLTISGTSEQFPIDPSMYSALMKTERP